MGCSSPCFRREGNQCVETGVCPVTPSPQRPPNQTESALQFLDSLACYSPCFRREGNQCVETGVCAVTPRPQRPPPQLPFSPLCGPCFRREGNQCVATSLCVSR